MMVATTASSPTSATGSSRRTRTSAEAARYSVLRRLAPALRHDMVVNLQALAMMAEVLSAKLEKGSPAPAEFESSVNKMNRLARDAVMTCLKATAWIEPAEDESIRLADGVAECVDLLRSSFNFRGCGIHNEVQTAEIEVSRVALRNLLTASLITLADSAQGPCDLFLTADVSTAFAVLTVRCTPIPPDEGTVEDLWPAPTTYRALEWADVQALAMAEGVELFRTESQIAMRIPRMVASGPVQIAPV